MSLMINYIATATDAYARDRAHAFELIAKKFSVDVEDLRTQDFVRFTELVTIQGVEVALIIDHMKVIHDRRWTHEPRI